MSAPRDPADPPMAEPGKRPTGSTVGVAVAPQSGGAEGAQRSSERSEDATGRARTGDAAGAAADPRIDRGGKAAAGSGPGTSARPDRPPSDDRATPARAGQSSGRGASDARAKRNDGDDEDEWRHEPVAPVDEPNPLRSLGKAVGDALTGSDQDGPAPPKR